MAVFCDDQQPICARGLQQCERDNAEVACSFSNKLSASLSISTVVAMSTAYLTTFKVFLRSHSLRLHHGSQLIFG
jgi:hypothetical protein